MRSAFCPNPQSTHWNWAWLVWLPTSTWPQAPQIRLVLRGEHSDHGNSRVYLPKTGWVRYRNSRAIEGTPKNLTVALESERCVVSIQTERTVLDMLPAADSAVDLGVDRFATLSDGIVYQTLDSFR